MFEIQNRIGLMDFWIIALLRMAKRSYPFTHQSNNPQNLKFRALLICSILLCWCSSGIGQTGVPFNQRDDQYRLLGLKRAKEAYEYAHKEYNRKKELFEETLISELDVSRSRNS